MADETGMVVSLKEHFDKSEKYLKELIDEKFKARDKAMELASEEMKIWKEEHNQFKDQLDKKTEQFYTIKIHNEFIEKFKIENDTRFDKYDMGIEIIKADVNLLKEDRNLVNRMASKKSVKWTWIFLGFNLLINVVTVIVYIIYVFIGRK